MKINTLTVLEFRGIRELKLPLDGRSTVIWGDNGVGKSGIVDAVDFLLSGDVTRLSGRGAGDLSLIHHGPHVRATAEAARIEADVTLSDGTTHSVSRSVSHANQLVGDAAVLAEFARVSDRGQHLLTRRDILAVVTVPPGDRAEQINELLNLSPIEQARGRLVTLKNNTAAAAASARDRVSQQQIRLADVSNLNGYQPEAVLSAINELRRRLDLAPVASLDEDVTQGAPPAVPLDQQAAQRLSARDALNSLQELLALPSTVPEIQENFNSACAASDDLIAIHEHKRAIAVASLVEAGISLLDGTGLCPLCDMEWNPQDLARHLDAKHDATRAAQEASERLTVAADQLRGGRLNRLTALAGSAVAAVERAGPVTPWLLEWQTALSRAVVDLADPIDTLASPHSRQTIDAAIIPSASLGDRLEALKNSISVDQEPTDQTRAHEQLIRIDQERQNLQDAEAAVDSATNLADAALLLHDSFLTSRDEVLNDLYESVRDRFVEFYRLLHPEEAESFGADIGPTDRGGVDLSVDFHAAGRYPPNAVHSEGHQDSMGLCLFLALAEALTGGAPPELLLLDDVVMSVDMDHRGKVAELLRLHFPATQFILTTHDRAWANYLQKSGVIRPSDRWEFRTWDIENGPSVGRAADVWTRIEAQLDGADVPGAAETLRRHAEETLFSVCDALQARVRLRADAQYQAGDLGDPAFDALKDLINRGIRKADDLNDQVAVQRLQARQSQRAQAHTDLKVHEWSVNAQIHWNELLRFTATEFRRVASVYRDALGLFECEECHSPIGLLFDGDGRPSAVRCSCAAIGWPL